MKLGRITVLMAVGTLLVLLLPVGAGPLNHHPEPDAWDTAALERVGSGWIFEGCFAFFPSGACFDVFVEPSGTYWVCKVCGTTKQPSPRVCRHLTQWQLENGFWCY